MGLKSDGSVVAWGWNPYGQCDVPEPNGDFVAVAACGVYSGGFALGLKSRIDLDVFDAFADCMTGPDFTPPPACDGADLDADADVDLADFAELQRTLGR